jgi:ubiquinone/menaquinone biosynthesis C-methylase UbiE
MNQPKTSWGQVADWYDRHLSDEDTYHQQVILPNLLRAVAPKADDNILDLACGSGFFSRALAATGAQVIGADISPELIALAKKRAGDNSRLTFKVSPSTPLSIANQKITKAISILAIQNIAEVKETFTEVARVLKPNGLFFLVLNHPAFRVPKASSWGWDEKEKIQYRRIDRYLSESQTEIAMHPGSNPNQITVSFHRPLQYYFKLFAAAGFAVTRLEEWISHRASDPGSRAEAENSARKEIPLFLFLEAKLL